MSLESVQNSISSVAVAHRHVHLALKDFKIRLVIGLENLIPPVGAIDPATSCSVLCFVLELLRLANSIIIIFKSLVLLHM